MKHTKGPWGVNALDRRGTYQLETDLISTDEALANAKLIAAAPDMLNALEHILKEIDSDPGYSVKHSKDAIRKVNEALKKAKGTI